MLRVKISIFFFVFVLSLLFFIPRLYPDVNCDNVAQDWDYTFSFGILWNL